MTYSCCIILCCDDDQSVSSAILLWNVDRITSHTAVYPGTDAEDDISGSANGEDVIPYCTNGNYTFYSTIDRLSNVTGNTIINISADVVLSSNVILNGVNNITIIGQGNPTVYTVLILDQ